MARSHLAVNYALNFFLPNCCDLKVESYNRIILSFSLFATFKEQRKNAGVIWQSCKKLKTIGKKSKIDFTGPAVPVSGTLKFGGAGPVGPLKEITKERPGYEFCRMLSNQYSFLS